MMFFISIVDVSTTICHSLLKIIIQRGIHLEMEKKIITVHKQKAEMSFILQKLLRG